MSPAEEIFSAVAQETSPGAGAGVLQQILEELKLMRNGVIKREVSRSQDAAVAKPAVATALASAPEPKKVSISINVKRIYDVRTKEQEFTARLLVDMYWEMPPGETPPPESEDDGDWTPEWTPKFWCKAAKSEDRMEMYTTEEKNGKTYIHGFVMMLVTISEGFELKKFPNDCQDLTICLQSLTPSQSMKLVSPARLLGDAPVVELSASGMYLDDFALLDKCPFTYNIYLSQDQGVYTYSTIQIKIKVVRQCWYYIINVALIMFLICSFVLCAWAVHPGAIADRWGVDFNLVLTAVAFKLILNDMLPRLSYLTTLDLYVLSGFVFLALATFIHSCLPLGFHTKIDYSALTLAPQTVEFEEEVLAADLAAFYAYGGLWGLWNLAYSWYFISSRKTEIAEFTKTARREAAEIDAADDEILHNTNETFIKTTQTTQARSL